MMKVHIRAALRAPDGLKRLLDFVIARVLFALPAAARKRLFAGTRYYCPICGSSLSRFLVLHRAYHLWCPVCRSLQRHRLIWLMFQRRNLLIGQSSPRKLRMLHIAPEEGLAAHFRRAEGIQYLSGDLLNPRAMVKMDICDIQYPASSFDFILCSHVLEHVPDDRQAMREFYRVLSSGGWALILVPLRAGDTIEDPSVVDPAERERLFGQYDHVRVYGPDVRQRLEAAGFRVTPVTARSIVSEEDIDRMGLPGGDSLFVCEKVSMDIS